MGKRKYWNWLECSEFIRNYYFMHETLGGNALLHALSALKQAVPRSYAAVSAGITDKFHWQLSQLMAQTNTDQYWCQGQYCCHRTAWSQLAATWAIHTFRGIWATLCPRSAVRKGKRTVLDAFAEFWNYNMAPRVCESWLARGISCTLNNDLLWFKALHGFRTWI
jgi:hypothetical protein